MSGCSDSSPRDDQKDKTCGVCVNGGCASGHYMTGCDQSGSDSGQCNVCTECDEGHYRKNGCEAAFSRDDAKCHVCPPSTYSFTGNDLSCDGYVASNVQIKQFSTVAGTMFGKHTTWTGIAPGVMEAAQESKYANEATISFDIPANKAAGKWDEIRFYCRKGDTNDLCDSGFNVDKTYTDSDADGRYFTCLRADVLASKTCSCRGESSFAMSGSHDDCGAWSDGTGNKCYMDGNSCIDASGKAPVTTSSGRFVGACTPGLSNYNDNRPTCTSAVVGSKRRIFVVLRGLDTPRLEYRFKILVGHSGNWLKSQWRSAFARPDTQELRIVTTCGCTGSTGDGSPMKVAVRQTWDQTPATGNQFEISFDDASICESGIKMYVGDSGSEQASYLAVTSPTQSCFTGRQTVLISQKHDISGGLALGSSVTFCLQASQTAVPTYDSSKTCSKSLVQWAGRLSGLVHTSTGSAVSNAKVYLTHASWDGWEETKPQEAYIGCFADDGNRMLDINRGVVSTWRECVDACRTGGDSFAGIQNGNECRCGNDYGETVGAQYKQLSNTRCNKAGNNKSFLMGAIWTSAVFRTFTSTVGEGKPVGWGFKASVAEMVTRSPMVGTIADCKAACVRETLCVVFEIFLGTCRFFGPWTSNFNEGKQSAHIDYKGFDIGAYFENKHQAGKNPRVFIHRAVAVTDIKKTSAGVDTNFDINLMALASSVSTSTAVFTAHVQMFTNDFKHTFIANTTTVNVVHLASSPAVLGNGGFEDSSSHSISGRITFANTGFATCGVASATITAYEVLADGVTFKDDPPDSLGDPTFTSSVGDDTGKYALTVPRSTRVRLVVNLWDPTRPETCGNSTWIALSCAPVKPAGTSWALLKAYHADGNACGCKHDFLLDAAKQPNLFLTTDMSNYDYTDTTTRKLRVEAFGGACAMALGTMTLKIRGKNCIAHEFTAIIPDGSKAYEFAGAQEIAAMDYRVLWDSSVLTNANARPGVSKGDVDAKLMEDASTSTAGTRDALLTWSDQTATYMYKARPDMTVSISNTAYPQCTPPATQSGFEHLLMKQG